MFDDNLRGALTGSRHDFALIIIGDIVAATDRIEVVRTFAGTDTGTVLASSTVIALDVFTGCTTSSLDYDDVLLGLAGFRSE